MIRIETDAYYLILEAIQNKKFQMITSPVHFEEVHAIKDPHERYELLALLTKYGTSPHYALEKIRARAEYLYSKKLALLTLPILPSQRQRQIFLYHVMKSC